MARELFGGPAWDEVLRNPPPAPEEPTAGERLLYALGQLLRLHHAGRFPVHPCELDIEDLIRVLGASEDFEFVSRNRLGRHYHFSGEVLTASAKDIGPPDFPWRLLSAWEWAAEQELQLALAERPHARRRAAMTATTHETTRAADAVLILFGALSEAEQAEVAERIHEMRLRWLTSGETVPARCLRSLRRVAEHLGHTPSTAEYKRVSDDLRATGEDIETFNRVYTHYGAWPRAREALALSETSGVTAIEARFQHRRVGKPWRYPESVLRETLMRCADYYGHPPLCTEFAAWRDREFELALGRGEEHELYMPTRVAYRRRYGGWEEALLHFGFTPEELDRRYDRRAEFTNDDVELPEGLPVAGLADPSGSLPLSPEQAQRMVAAYRLMPRRSRYVLTGRLGLGVSPQPLKAVARPLTLHLSRIAQLQSIAFDALCRAAAGDGRGRPDPASLRDRVEATLRALTVTG